MSENINPFQDGTTTATSTESAPTVQPVPQEQAPVVDPPKRKVFSRRDIVRGVKCPVHLPKLYPDYEPWTFHLRIKLSKDAEDRRQEYFSLSPMEQTIKQSEQALDEICDLLIELPTGFEDLQDLGKGPGHAFRSYVETSDADAKEILYKIVEGASSLYWNYTSPREFRG